MKPDCRSPCLPETQATSPAGGCRGAGNRARRSGPSAQSTTTAFTVVEPTSKSDQVSVAFIAHLFCALWRAQMRLVGSSDPSHAKQNWRRPPPHPSAAERGTADCAVRDVPRRIRECLPGAAACSRQRSNSAFALVLASPRAICTRLWALISPSPAVSIGRKIISGKRLTTADCTPSDCDDGMQPNGFNASTI